MKTNTELLMNAVGWQGGTIHQVAAETGLTVMEILDLDKAEIHSPIAYDHGLKAVRLGVVDICGHQAYRVCKYKPDQISFWLGVLTAQKAKN